MKLENRTLEELHQLLGSILGSGYPWPMIKREVEQVESEIRRRTLFKTDEQIAKRDRAIIKERGN